MVGDPGPDPRLFSLDDPYEATSTEVACALYEGQALHPIERYLEAFYASLGFVAAISLIPSAARSA